MLSGIMHVLASYYAPEAIMVHHCTTQVFNGPWRMERWTGLLTMHYHNLLPCSQWSPCSPCSMFPMPYPLPPRPSEITSAWGGCRSAPGCGGPVVQFQCEQTITNHPGEEVASPAFDGDGKLGDGYLTSSPYGWYARSGRGRVTSQNHLVSKCDGLKIVLFSKSYVVMVSPERYSKICVWTSMSMFELQCLNTLTHVIWRSKSTWATTPSMRLWVTGWTRSNWCLSWMSLLPLTPAKRARRRNRKKTWPSRTLARPCLSLPWSRPSRFALPGDAGWSDTDSWTPTPVAKC